MVNFNAIGIKIKSLRERSGLSQTQLAAFLNVDQSFISKCEKGERQLSIDALEKACNLFGCTLYELSDEHIQHLQFAFRATSISNDDLDAISNINKIVLNLKQMQALLGMARS